MRVCLCACFVLCLPNQNALICIFSSLKLKLSMIKANFLKSQYNQKEHCFVLWSRSLKQQEMIVKRMEYKRISVNSQRLT